MRLADDDRARVPFAVVGVLLLVASVGVATVQLDGDSVEPDARQAGDRATAVAESALRDAVHDAGATAAASPVVEPANTSFGRLLDEERPYRSYLELLVALRLRERTAESTQRVDETRARVELSPIVDRASARDALNRTSVEAAGTGLVAATVEDVRVVVERDGTVVDERTADVSVTVATPALTLHDRTEAFQRRLEGGIRMPGSVTRGLTGGLYGLAWTRGWGQHLGLPISDPIANRHAELVANLAVIDAQRTSFGRSDPDAQDGLAAAGADVAAEEAVGFVESGLNDAGVPAPERAAISAATDAPEPARTTTVGVDGTADRALADLLQSGDGTDDAAASRSLTAVVRDATTVEARLATGRDRRSRELVERTGPENLSEWRYERGSPSVSVERVFDAGDPDHDGTVGTPDEDGLSTAVEDDLVPAAADGWSTGRVVTRRVEIESVVPITYAHESTLDVERGRERYRRTVDVAVAVRHRPSPLEGPVARPLADRDGRLYGRLVDRATTDLLAADVDAMAGDVATGSFEAGRDARVAVSPAPVRPQADEAYDHLAELRETLRSVETDAELSATATDANPAATLRDRVEAGRERYVDVPLRYDGLAQRAVVAARAAYVDRTLARLDDRARAHRATQDTVDDTVGDLTGGLDVGLADVLSVGLDHARPEPQAVNATTPAPDLQLSVDGDPGYLDREAVSVADGAARREYHPLATKTSTMPTLPTDEIASGVGGIVGDALFDVEESVPLPTGARSLRGANRVPDAVATERTLSADRAQLRDEVASAVATLEERSAAILAEETTLGERRAEQTVERGLARWEGPAGRALAFENGSASDAVASAAADRPSVSDRDADRVRTLVRDDVSRALGSDETHVRHPTVERVADGVRAYTESVVEERTADGLESVEDELSDRFRRVPVVGLRGAPVAPIPGYWLATANVWHVEVEGTWARFAVAAQQGGPAGGATVSYVRDGGTVRLDVTGSGTRERLGAATRLQVDAETTVLVAVPPNGPGVGNDDADLTQTSPGWERWAERADEDDAAEYAGGLERSDSADRSDRADRTG